MQTHRIDDFYFGGVVWRRCKNGIFFAPRNEVFQAYFHKFLYEAAYGCEPRPGRKVAHIDGDWDNNDPINLEERWGDPWYIVQHGLRCKGHLADPAAVDLRQHHKRKFKDAMYAEETVAYRCGVTVEAYRRYCLEGKASGVVLPQRHHKVMSMIEYLEEARRWDEISSLVKPWYPMPVQDLAAK